MSCLINNNFLGGGGEVKAPPAPHPPLMQTWASDHTYVSLGIVIYLDREDRSEQRYSIFRHLVQQ